MDDERPQQEREHDDDISMDHTILGDQVMEILPHINHMLHDIMHLEVGIILTLEHIFIHEIVLVEQHTTIIQIILIRIDEVEQVIHSMSHEMEPANIHDILTDQIAVTVFQIMDIIVIVDHEQPTRMEVFMQIQARIVMDQQVSLGLIVVVFVANDHHDIVENHIPLAHITIDGFKIMAVAIIR